MGDGLNIGHAKFEVFMWHPSGDLLDTQTVNAYSLPGLKGSISFTQREEYCMRSTAELGPSPKEH